MADGSTTPDDEAELPGGVIEEAVRLTRLARRAIDPDEAAAYRADRDERLAAHGFRARVREEPTRDVLVCYPADWLEDGTVRIDRIEDTGRAIERQLSGPGGGDDWDALDAHNREITAAVEADGGPVHGANARAFADFMGNHYARRVETAAATEVEEFLTEYFPRNAWPTDDQRAIVEESLHRIFEAADAEPLPDLPDRTAATDESGPDPAER